jgi:hypothetical protein
MVHFFGTFFLSAGLLTGFAFAQPSQLVSPHDLRQQALLKLCWDQVRSELKLASGEEMESPAVRDRMTECLRDHRAWYIIRRPD